MKNVRLYVGVVVPFLLALLAFPAQGLAQSPEITWIEGPQTVDLGKNLAQVDLAEGYAFAGAEDTKTIMELSGNPPSGDELGIIVPTDESANWFLILEYASVGYIKDDEKDSIDADALLASIRENTEQANELREEQGVAPIHVIGWYEKPHYDDQSHNLVWTILGESEGERVANYNVRLLGRSGYTSVVLVTDEATLDQYKPEVEHILAAFSYKSGKTYAEYREGDKVAKYGLTALVAGGAGAAMAKTGLFKVLAKYVKFVILAIIAFLGALWKKIKSIFSGSPAGSVSYESDFGDSPAESASYESD
jgi:uncharacterized membrane-anchored protein